MAKKEKCKTCGRELEMYYRLWCPKCDRPQRQQQLVLNMHQALRYVEVQEGIEGYAQRVWARLCDLGIVANDTTSGLCVDWDRLDDPEDGGLDEQERMDYILLRNTFGITDDENLLFEFSW